MSGQGAAHLFGDLGGADAETKLTAPDGASLAFDFDPPFPFSDGRFGDAMDASRATLPATSGWARAMAARPSSSKISTGRPR